MGPVLYLASDASSFVPGDDISVSGGNDDVRISPDRSEAPGSALARRGLGVRNGCCRPDQHAYGRLELLTDPA